MQDARAGQDHGTTGPDQESAVADVPTPKPRLSRKPRRPVRRTRISLTVILTLIALALGFGYLALAYSGKTLRLPVWVVAEAEARLNASLAEAQLPPGSALSLGSVEFAVDPSFVPRLRLEDIRLIGAAGRSLLSLPEALVSFDPEALLSGKVRPGALRLVGGQLAVRRDRFGKLDLEFGGAAAGGGPKSAGELLTLAETLFALPLLESLRVIEAEALTLTLTDDRARRFWQVGDGRLTIENKPDTIALELGLTLLEGAVPAQATVTIVAQKGAGTARLGARVDNVAAADLAAMAPPLAWLGSLRAPISGMLAADVSVAEGLTGLTAGLSLDAGSLAPGDGARPIPFDSAALSLRYDPVTARLTLTDLVVQSPSLRLRAQGHGDLVARNGGPLLAGDLPDRVRAQISFAEVVVDPEGLFEEPVRFGRGALDLRLRLDPFRLEIGQLALVEDDSRLHLSGSIEAGQMGWTGALDVTLDKIDSERLLKLWPVSVVPRTRDWFADNVGKASLTAVKAALRFAPGAVPKLSLGYEFAEAEVRLVKTLPPVLDARGHAALEGQSYTVMLDRGHVIPPEGGRIEADGSVFQVLDVTQRPATARIKLVTSSRLTATLSLLDQEPFSFFSKAGQPVNLGDGQAELVTVLEMPLKQKITLPDVSYVVTGRIVDFTSPALVPGRILSAPEVLVAVDTDGLELSGKGRLDILPVELTYVQGFGPEQKGRARVNGTVILSDPALRAFGIEFPAGSIKGEGLAAIDIALVSGRAPELTLTSTLTGLALRLDAIGWTKLANGRADLDLEARLSSPPVVEKLVLNAPGLLAEGAVTTGVGGGLEEARFSRVKVGDWLDAPVTLTGKGPGRPFDITVNGGWIDQRYMPDNAGGGGAASGAMRLTLDRLQISRGIALTGFSGRFEPGIGLNGRFTTAVNGKGAVQGLVAPMRGGTGFRITSENAGAVMAAAGIFENGRGGSLELTLTPRGRVGEYVGKATFTRMRVQNAPALAELLSAVSVVGLLEQLNGEGLAFNNGEVDFNLTPEALQITQGSAVGASLGISFAGLYLMSTGQLDLRGVISPIYLVNGLGQIFSRRGEGLFGFNYRLSGTVEDPKVQVNPLSVLTPGMFREIFRQAPPNLKSGG